MLNSGLQDPNTILWIVRYFRDLLGFFGIFEGGEIPMKDFSASRPALINHFETAHDVARFF